MKVEIIAEIGASHGQNLDTAKKLCVQAMEAGADAVKLQTYTPDTISFPDAGICPSGPWQGRKLYDLYREAHMPRDMQHDLIAFLTIQKIPWFSTPFSPEDVSWLVDHGCPRYKLSSFDVHNLPLIEAIAATGKPRIASDGMDRVYAGAAAGAHGIVLRCVSNYPAYANDYGLADPPRAPWGISDHSTGDTVGIVAMAKGASMIERHIKLDDDHATPDHAFATPLCQFRVLVHRWREVLTVAQSRISIVPFLRAIMPRPVTIDGKTAWRRCVKEGIDATLR